MPLHVSSTIVLIISRSKLYFTASGIITLKQVNVSVMIPDAVQYNFDLLMMNTQCSEHVEAYNRLVIKQDFVHQVG